MNMYTKLLCSIMLCTASTMITDARLKAPALTSRISSATPVRGASQEQSEIIVSEEPGGEIIAEQDSSTGTWNNDASGSQIMLHVFLVSQNPQGEMMVHEVRTTKEQFFVRDTMGMSDAEIEKTYDLAESQSIFQSLDAHKNLQAITSHRIFQLALEDSVKNEFGQDSVKHEFNDTFWKRSPDEKEYFIILPAPYVNNITWHKISSIQDPAFKSLWENAQKGIRYYLSAYQDNTWPLRSYSNALKKWASAEGMTPVFIK